LLCYFSESVNDSSATTLENCQVFSEILLINQKLKLLHWRPLGETTYPPSFGDGVNPPG
jgi:hypothetical protein